jgi:hypothetical protein
VGLGTAAGVGLKGTLHGGLRDRFEARRSPTAACNLTASHTRTDLGRLRPCTDARQHCRTNHNGVSYPQAVATGSEHASAQRASGIDVDAVEESAGFPGAASMVGSSARPPSALCPHRVDNRVDREPTSIGESST